MMKSGSNQTAEMTLTVFQEVQQDKDLFFARLQDPSNLVFPSWLHFVQQSGLVKAKAFTNALLMLSGTGEGLQRKGVMAFVNLVAPGGQVFVDLGEESLQMDEGLIKSLKLAGLVGLEKVQGKRYSASKRVVNKTKIPVKSAAQKKSNPFAAVAAQKQDQTANKMINDEDLLANDTVESGAQLTDCSTQPKACNNCSCGRKEMEETLGKEELKKQLENTNIKSACGSCYLGDAFRCATCPYKGKPAFQPGDKLKLDLGNSATVEGTQSTETKIVGGRV